MKRLLVLALCSLACTEHKPEQSLADPPPQPIEKAPLTLSEAPPQLRSETVPSLDHVALSINVIGVHSCAVHVDGESLSIAPIFLHRLSTTGPHDVDIRCPDGRGFKRTIVLGVGDNRLVLKPDDLTPVR